MAKDSDTSEQTSEKRERRARTARGEAPSAVNTLAPTPAPRAPDAHEPPPGARARPAGVSVESERPSSTPGAKPPSGAPAAFTALPDGILDRYYRIGSKYYLDNGEHAFTHHADRLTTPSENTEIVRDLVEIARHNGMHDITVTGTERFRREAWKAATRLGLEVRGYEPTLHDEKQLVRAMAREDSSRLGAKDAGRGAAPESDGPSAAAAATAASAGAPGGPDAVRAAGTRRAAGQGRTYTGELIDHGPEHYQRNPKEDMSYFVQVGTQNGAIDLWGLDLKRALAEAKSRPKVGDPIVVRQTGKRDVTVRSREFDAAGEFLGERAKDTYRNRWSIEKEEFVRERAQLAAALRDEQVTPERGAQAHPQLLGSYFILKEAEEYAKQRYRSREERQTFVESTRKRLAEIIERGESLPTTRIRKPEPQRTRASSQDPLAAQGPGA